MKRFKATTVLLIGAALLTSAPTLAGPFPSQVGFESRAVDEVGEPLEGTFDMVFRYVDLTGATLVTERQDDVQVTAGLFEVELGSGRLDTTTFDSLESVFSAHPQVEVEVTIGDVVQSPRV